MDAPTIEAMPSMDSPTVPDYQQRAPKLMAQVPQMMAQPAFRHQHRRRNRRRAKWLCPITQPLFHRRWFPRPRHRFCPAWSEPVPRDRRRKKARSRTACARNCGLPSGKRRSLPSRSQQRNPSNARFPKNRNKTQATKPVAANRSSNASRNSQARVAKGSGGGAAKGNNKKSQTATLSKSQKQSLMAQWGSQIRSRIAHRAPRGVGRGTALVTITVSGNGSLLGVRLAKSSGNAKLDNLAVGAVRNAGRFPPAPGNWVFRGTHFSCR